MQHCFVYRHFQVLQSILTGETSTVTVAQVPSFFNHARVLLIWFGCCSLPSAFRTCRILPKLNMIKISGNNVSKTPISILQEYMVKKNGIIPQYELIYSSSSATRVWFKFQLTISNLTVVGEGASKKEAKHNTAQAMLIQLQVPIAPGPKEVSKVHENIPKVSNNFNAIGSLHELCSRFRLPAAQYFVVKEDGPPHKKEFTIKCVVGNEFDTSTANSKQDAKHQSAAKLLKRLDAMSLTKGDLSQENHPCPSLTPEELKEIIEKFKASSTLMKQRKLPSSASELPFKDYHHISKTDTNFKSSVINSLAGIWRLNHRASFDAHLEMNHDHLLKNFLQELSLDHDFITIPPHKKTPSTVIALNINYAIPISFLGIGKTATEARSNASIDALNWLVRLYV